MKAIIILCSVLFLIISCKNKTKEPTSPTTQNTQSGTPTPNTPTPNTPNQTSTNKKSPTYTSPALSERHPPVKCDIDNYKDFIKKQGVHNCNLQGVKWYKAGLQSSNLIGADLRRADLRFADLRGADLQGADLRDADLQSAIFHGADLRGADLRVAYLRWAKLSNTKVTRDQAKSLRARGYSGFVIVE